MIMIYSMFHVMALFTNSEFPEDVTLCKTDFLVVHVNVNVNGNGNNLLAISIQDFDKSG